MSSWVEKAQAAATERAESRDALSPAIPSSLTIYNDREKAKSEEAEVEELKGLFTARGSPVSTGMFTKYENASVAAQMADQVRREKEVIARKRAEAQQTRYEQTQARRAATLKMKAGAATARRHVATANQQRAQEARDELATQREAYARRRVEVEEALRVRVADARALDSRLDASEAATAERARERVREDRARREETLRQRMKADAAAAEEAREERLLMESIAKTEGGKAPVTKATVRRQKVEEQRLARRVAELGADFYAQMEAERKAKVSAALALAWRQLFSARARACDAGVAAWTRNHPPFVSGMPCSRMEQLIAVRPVPCTADASGAARCHGLAVQRGEEEGSDRAFEHGGGRGA